MKIIFFSLFGDSFLLPIIDSLQKEGHDTILYNQKNPITTTLESQNSDIVWFEWADEPLISISNNPTIVKNKNYRVICRLHSFEVFNQNIHNINWNYVDDLIFVNDNVKELFITNMDKFVTHPKIHVIANGINTNKFKTPPNKKYNKKLAYIGYINHKKNIPLLLYCFKAIHDYDNEYSLHIAGEFQDHRLILYVFDMLKKMKLNIDFSGRVENIYEWLYDKSYIFSTSLFESYQYGCMEGIASGLMPLIHHWYGAEKLYPNCSLFLTPEQCLDNLKTYNILYHKGRMEKTKINTLDNQVSEIKKLLGV